jgi:hypothetical protein
LQDVPFATPNWKITRQTAAARFFGWPIEGGYSPITDVLGGD